MPTVLTHALIGTVAGAATSRILPLRKMIVLSTFCAALPDLDGIGLRLGVPYAHPFGHRGISHSLLFAVILGGLVATLFFRRHRAFSRPWWLLSGYFAALTAIHGLLDALTNGGLGVALLAPFDLSRYFFSVTPIQVSPIGLRAFWDRGWPALQSEICWIWGPALVLAVLARRVLVLCSARKQSDR